MKETSKYQPFQAVMENTGWGPLTAKFLTARTTVSQDSDTQNGLDKLNHSLQEGPAVFLVGHHDLVDMIRLGHAMLSLDLPVSRVLAPVAFASYKKRLFQELCSQMDEVSQDYPDIEVDIHPVFRRYEYTMYKEGFFSKDEMRMGMKLTKEYQQKTKTMLNLDAEDSRGNVVALAPGAGMRRRGEKQVLNTGVAELMQPNVPVFFAALKWVPHGVLGLLNNEVVLHPEAVRFGGEDSFQTKRDRIDEVFYDLEGDITEESWLKRKMVISTQNMIDVWRWERRAKNLIGSVSQRVQQVTSK